MIISGKARWAKILGAPHWGYEEKNKEWSVDVYPDADTVKKLKSEGLGKKLKDKGNGTFITFKRRELKQDGTPNTPIRVVDDKGQAWNPKVKIGNDSVVNVNFLINEWGKGEKSANILSLQVWEHVPYEGGEFPTREDDDNSMSSIEDDWTKEVA